jgi:hypothetical protein
VKKPGKNKQQSKGRKPFKPGIPSADAEGIPVIWGGVEILAKKRLIFELSASVISLLYLYFAMELPFGAVTRPGPGFLPVILGVCGAVISMILACGTYREIKKSKANNEKQESNGMDKPTLIRFILYVIACLAYTLLYEKIGTEIGVALLTFAVSKISGAKGWVKPLILGIGTSVAIYIVFKVGFMIPLPSLISLG